MIELINWIVTVIIVTSWILTESSNGQFNPLNGLSKWLNGWQLTLFKNQFSYKKA